MSERVVDTRSMSIYKKLAYLQSEAQEINTDNLEDLISNLQGLTFKYETTLIFSFTTDAVLKLKDWRSSNGEISIRLPLVDAGKINEYKESLLTNLFLLRSESVQVKDNITPENNNTNTADDSVEEVLFTQKEETTQTPKAVNLIKEHILKKDNTLTITAKMIYEQSRTLAKNDKIGLSTQKEVSDWYKNTKEDMII